MKRKAVVVVAGAGAGMLFGVGGAALGCWLGMESLRGQQDSLGFGMAIGMMMLFGLGVGFVVGAAVGIPLMTWVASKKYMLTPVAILAVLGYGALAWGGAQWVQLMSDARSGVNRVQAAETAKKIRAKSENGSSLQASKTPRTQIESDPRWQLATSFPAILSTYPDLIYPGARVSREPDHEHSDMVVLATADALPTVAAFYRSKTHPQVDTPEKFVGTLTLPDGKTAFVGVADQQGLTFVSITSGRTG